MRCLEIVLARDFRLNRSRRVVAIYRTSSLVVRLAGVRISKNLKRRGVGSNVHVCFCCPFMGGRRRGGVPKRQRKEKKQERKEERTSDGNVRGELGRT